jgi:hypothetical protein
MAMGVLYRWTKGSEPMFEVADDALVLRALAEVGISPTALDDPLAPKGPAGGATGTDHQQQPWMGTGLWADHPSHWLLFIQFSGYARAADNGWYLKGLRKSRYTREQAEADITATLRNFGVTHIESMRWMDPDGTPSPLN